MPPGTEHMGGGGQFLVMRVAETGVAFGVLPKSLLCIYPILQRGGEEAECSNASYVPCLFQ